MKGIVRSNFYIYGIIILLAVLESVSMSSLKISKGYDVYLIASILCFVSLVFLFRELLKYKNLSIAYLLYHLGTILLVSLISFVIYKEKFSTKEKIGLIMAVTAIILMSDHSH
tara:strand:- start:307 stop:645 length:339 start_codon:yes stop_codon:yes gene_type:complete